MADPVPPAPEMNLRISTRQRLWKALRVQKACDPVILAMAAGVPVPAAREYLGILVRGGYARVTSRGNGRTGRLNKYQLVRDTGPRAPRRVAQGLLDENSGETVALAQAQQTRRPALKKPASDEGEMA